MGLEILAAKIVFAVIFGIILVNVVAPGISIIGMVTCPNCNSIVNAFIFIVVPIGAAFIGVTKVIEIFTRTNRG
jgi:hypothetical protein